MSVQALSVIIPAAIMPGTLGWALTKFPDHTTGFQWFFLIGGTIGFVMVSTASLPGFPHLCSPLPARLSPSHFVALLWSARSAMRRILCSTSQCIR